MNRSVALVVAFILVAFASIEHVWQRASASGISSTSVQSSARQAAGEVASDSFSKPISKFLSARSEASGSAVSTQSQPSEKAWAEFSSALSTLGYQSKELLSAQLVQFDAQRLIDMYDSARKNGTQGITTEILGTHVRLELVSAFIAPGDRKIRSLLFKAVDHDGWVQIAVDEKTQTVAGDALLNGNSYDIGPLPGVAVDKSNVQHVVVGIRQFGTEPNQINDSIARPLTKGPNKVAHSQSLAKDTTSPSTASNDACAKGSVVNVEKRLTLIFAYTSAAEKSASSRHDGDNIGIPVLVVNAQSSLGGALRSAGVDISVWAIDAMQVTYNEPTTGTQQHILDEELDALRTDKDGAFSAFKKARKDRKADIGILIVDNADPFACGKAQQSADAANAFAVVNWRCMGPRLATEHEVGHVLGLFHDDDKAAVPVYARGFMHASENDLHPFTTIMGQPDHCQAKTYCYRTRKYSNPYDTNNLPGEDGKVTIGSPGQIDSACVLRRTVPLALDFGDQL